MPLGSIVGASWYSRTRPRVANPGWDVELLYATTTSDGTPIDQAADPNGKNAVAARAAEAHGNLGLRVLVRVDYAQGQSVPPTGDNAARTEYVRFLETICRDDVYRQNVFGYIIGNEFNWRDENRQLNWTGGARLSPDWYARMFNGYGADATDQGNAYSFIRTHQPGAWVLVGAVAPWNQDSEGDALERWRIDVPWLNYFYAVCRRISSTGRDFGRWPDGFAIHAYGRTQGPGSPSFTRNEPHTNVPFTDQGDQGGFRVYRDWTAIMDGAGFTPDLPIFVTETNTRTDGEHVSSRTYPSGWYLEALRELQAAGGRFHALCWFVDDPTGGWEDERLTSPQGNCVQAEADFNAALADGF